MCIYLAYVNIFVVDVSYISYWFVYLVHEFNISSHHFWEKNGINLRSIILYNSTKFPLLSFIVFIAINIGINFIDILRFQL